MRVLLTGSSGQIGTNLALRLRREGHTVFGVDKRINSWTEAFDTLHQALARHHAALHGGGNGTTATSTTTTTNTATSTTATANTATVAAAQTGVPHLPSPGNPPPGTTDEPIGESTNPNVGYVKDLWHALQNQEIDRSDLLLALTQRSMTSPIPTDPHTNSAPVASAYPVLILEPAPADS